MFSESFQIILKAKFEGIYAGFRVTNSQISNFIQYLLSFD